MGTRVVRHLAIAFLVVAGFGFKAVAADAPLAKPDPSQGSGGEYGTFKDEKIEIAKAEREYRLVAPKSIDPKTPVPLVIAYHGLGDSKDIMPWYSKLDKLAEDKKFIVIFPNGRLRMWPLLPDMTKDDIAFFDGLYDLATKKYNIDLNRVYVAGMSNGSYFSHVIAAQRSDKLAGIICHSGGLGAFEFKPIDVKNKYAVMIIHGDQDSIVNVSQGQKTRDAYQKWNHPVDYVELAGHGHWWGTKQQINDKIWTFMSDHPRK